MLGMEYSPSIRAGDSQIVKLRLFAVAGEPSDPILYKDYLVIAEARLDLPLADVRPAELVSAALVEGRGATFYWEVSPRQEGMLRGTVWLYLRFVPKAGGEEIRQPVSVQWVEIHSRSILGRSGSEARLLGVVGFVAGIGYILFLRKKRESTS